MYIIAIYFYLTTWNMYMYCVYTAIIVQFIIFQCYGISTENSYEKVSY